MGLAAPPPPGGGPDAGLFGVVVALSSGRPCFDFKVGSPGAGDDSSPYFCDSPNDPAGPGDAATHGGEQR
jgi:hypothetical protein